MLRSTCDVSYNMKKQKKAYYNGYKLKLLY